MARFDRQISTALRLIEKNGELVQWKIVQDGTPFDPLKPWKPSSSVVTTKDVTICFLPLTRVGDESLHRMKNSEVPTGCDQGLMGAVDFEPSEKDVIVRNGKEWRIENISILAPNGQNILYTIEFKK